MGTRLTDGEVREMQPIDLALVVLDIVVRAGTPLPDTLRDAYSYDKVYRVSGISVVMHSGWDVDALARVAHFRHGKISYATVQQLQQALADAGYELVLHSTPTADLPDHHTLSVAQNGARLDHLPDAAADALALVLLPNLLKNPYQQRP